MKGPLNGEIRKLQTRNTKLAESRAKAQFIVSAYNALSKARGVDAAIDTILALAMQLHGGSNVILYYLVDDQWLYKDVFGKKDSVDIRGDRLLQRTIFDRVISESFTKVPEEMQFRGPTMPANLKANTIVFPLVVGETTIAALKIDQRFVFHQLMTAELTAFFSYAALILNNEILNYNELQQAHIELEQIFQTNPDGMLIIDGDQIIRRINDSLLKLLELQDSKIIGRKLQDVLTVKNNDIKVETLLLTVLQEGAIESEAIVMGMADSEYHCIVTARALRLRGLKSGAVINI
ncbi:hypothetical protein LCGC14_3005090, partial [marine sediment metagenome]